MVKQLSSGHSIALEISLERSGFDHGRYNDLGPHVAHVDDRSLVIPGRTGIQYDAQHTSRRVPLSNMRQVIARRLVESKTTIPHYQVSMSFDMDPLMAMRKDLNEKLAGGDVKLSVNDFLVRAAALAMHQHPDFNASFDGDAIVQHGAVNVGIAISLPEDKGGGLVVGVIRDADRKSLRMISACCCSGSSSAWTGPRWVRTIVWDCSTDC